MEGIASGEFDAGSSVEGLSSGQSFHSGDALDNGAPSPPYWDSDDDGGPKPRELYGRYTWKIPEFSTINKRELRSSPFEVGGSKWYILIYPQGCDVCNHLSLFLCFATDDEFLPGWCEFAQFTIALVNKDPKKSKYSDTIHRFWKNERDWGWKKFMDLSKLSDGFIDADTLTIRAQVQVIRERADRPFHCLDCQYRRELVRVYLTNVEQICWKFVDDKRGKLGKLLQDKARWSSFCTFWLGIDESARRCMLREKMDMILKVIVKHFSIEKEVTRTLVMDSLYSGLKALEVQSNCTQGNAKLLEGEDRPASVVRVEKDMFVLVDDVLLQLERAIIEPLPSKDEKSPQDCTRDGSIGEDFNKDSIRYDERLTEMGRRTVEIYVLTHIFSKIEAAYQYQEDVSLKRQEKLIQEEKSECKQKANQGIAKKEKKSKKKQKKRKSRKTKDEVEDEKPDSDSEDKQLDGSLPEEVKDSLEGQTMLEKDDTLKDGSDVCDSVECSGDILLPDLENREEFETSDLNPPAEMSSSAAGNDISSNLHGGDKRNSSTMDDSSATCSAESPPSVVMNGLSRGNSYTSTNEIQRSSTSGESQRAKVISQEATSAEEAHNLTSEPVMDSEHQPCTQTQDKAAEPSKSEHVVSSSQEPIKKPDQKKEEEAILRKPSNKIHLDIDRQPKEKVSVESHSPQSPSRNTLPTVQTKSEEPKSTNFVDLTPARETTVDSMQEPEKLAPVMLVPQAVSVSKSTTKASGQQAPPMSRPSGARSKGMLKFCFCFGKNQFSGD